VARVGPIPVDDGMFPTGGEEAVVKRQDWGNVSVISVAAATALLASLIVPTLFPQVALAATCPTGNTHCYAQAQWQYGGAYGIFGQNVQLQTVHLYSANDGYNHISEEQWVIDTYDNCLDGVSWIEAGEATWTGHTGNWYFWADCRPGSTEYNHFLYQPPSGDVGQYQQYVISKRTSNTYLVWMQNASSGQIQWSKTSTSNTMAGADLLEIGLETTNNSYSVTHADPDYFRYTRFEGSDSNWYYQNQPGFQYSSYPPNWTWITKPAPGGTGGLVHDQLACSGTTSGSERWGS
jgi:hypothetical protein